MVGTLGKIIFGVLAVFILIIAIAVVFILRIDPNTYKPQIETLVQEQLGATLKVGSIGWQFWPNIGLQINEIQLAGGPQTNPETPKQLLNVGQARISVAVLPLLQSQVKINEILLEKPKIWFHQTADGQHNWQFILDNLAKQESAPTTNEPAAPMALDISIAEAKIVSGQLFISGAHQVTINPFHLALQNLGLNQAITLSFDAKTAAMNTTLDLKITSEFILAEQTLEVKSLKTSIKGPQANQDFSFESKASFNLDTLASSAAVTVAPLDLDAWSALAAQLPKTETATSSKTPTTSSSTPPSAPTEIPKEILKTLNTKLELTFKNIIYKQASHGLAFKVNAQEGRLKLNDFVLNAYDGTAKGNISLDVNKPKAQALVKLALEAMAIDKVTSTWVGMSPMAGAFSSSLDVSAEGNTVDALIKNLKGQSSLAMAQASLPKINLHELVWNGLQSKQGGLIQTLDAFPELKAQMGTLKTPKILREVNQLHNFLANIIITPENVTTNSIKASLNDQAIEAKLSYGRIDQAMTIQTALQLPFENKDLQQISWPLACTGSLAATNLTDAFKCSLDSSKVTPLLKNLANNQIKTRVKQELAPIETKAIQELKQVEDKAKTKLENKAQEKLGTSIKNLLGR